MVYQQFFDKSRDGVCHRWDGELVRELNIVRDG